MELVNPKLKGLGELIEERKGLERGRRVVLTNGCFDLLHAGHIYSLQEAAKQGDFLWVALNSDASVSALKGPSRPIQSELIRAYALAGLACVDRIFIFGTPRLDAEIRQLKPDVYVKSGDYTVETLDVGEREALQSVAAEIRFLPYLDGFSTTELLEKIATSVEVS